MKKDAIQLSLFVCSENIIQRFFSYIIFFIYASAVSAAAVYISLSSYIYNIRPTITILYSLYFGLFFTAKAALPYLDNNNSNDKFISSVISIFTKWTAIGFIASSTVAVILLYFRSTQATYQTIYFASFVVFIIFMYISSATIYRLISARLAFWKFRRNPEAYFCYTSLYIYFILSSIDNNNWTIQHKRALVSAFYYLSVITRRYILVGFPLKDGFVKDLSKDKINKISNSIVEKQIWVLYPNSKTKYDLLSYVSNIFNVFIFGKWDQFELSTFDERSNQSLSRGFLGKIYIVFTSILPIIILYIMMRFGNNSFLVALKNVEAPLWLATSSWTATMLLSRLGPSTKDKISAFKDLFSLLQGVGPK